MYLAEYDIGGTSWLQAACRLHYPATSDRAHARWWTHFKTLLRTFAADAPVSMALRVNTWPLSATLFAAAPAVAEMSFRRALGRFTQLGLVVGRGAEVEYMRDRDQHDAALAFPRYRCRIACPPLASGDAWFAFDFRAQAYLGDMLGEARDLDHAFSYHLNIEPFDITTDVKRHTALNALRVSGLAGVPPAIAQLQDRLARQIRTATHLCDELIGIDTPEARDWMTTTLNWRFEQAYGSAFRNEFVFEPAGYDEELVAARHKATFETLSIDEICAAAVGEEERVGLLSWEPPTDLIAPSVGVFAEESGAEHFVASPLARRAGMPVPYRGSEPYAFISYKREELGRIQELVTAVSRRGIRIWYDAGIPGGAEWDALIEERVQSCALLIVFLSQASIGSKYVRREVKFADAISKAVVFVRLDPDLTLTDGLAMLVNQYQTIDMRLPDVPERIEEAVRYLTRV